MIQATDLRIGNWVEAVGDKWEKETSDTKAGQHIQVTVYDMAHIAGCNKLNKEPSHAPIPITPEILIFYGFEKRLFNSGTTEGEEYTKDFGNDGFKLFFGWYKSAREWNDFKIIGNGCYDESGEKNINEICQYLHELQNLYYTGTKIELTPKP